MIARDTARPAPRPSLKITNCLFGENPDQVTLPFCAISPTITCSTMAVSYVLRRSPDATPALVAEGLARALEAYAQGGPRVAEVCGVEVRPDKLVEQGTAWPNERELSVEDFAATRAASRAAAQAEETQPEEERQEARRKADDKGRSRKMPEETAERSTEGRQSWPHVKFPNAFVRPYEKEAKDGRVWQKAICAIPPGTRVNGVDVGGYKLDLFMRDFHMQSKTLGKPVVFTLDPTRPHVAFKGEGDARREVSLMAWDLTRAMAKERREYAASRAEGTPANEPLEEQERSARESSSGRAEGKEASDREAR